MTNLRSGLAAFTRDLARSTAFIYRNYHLTRRYFSWFLVMVFYSVVSSATIVLIGVASGDQLQTLNLLLGVLMWSFLSGLFQEISQNVAYERWEGTIEYTFMAPVSTFAHLIGVSIFAAALAFFQTLVVLGALALFVDLNLAGANWLGVALVMAMASFSFMGLGLIAATFPILSPENGAQATYILQGIFLLISGVYYSIATLPHWLQPLSWLSPATYALNACRRLMGIAATGEGARITAGVHVTSVLPELAVLAVLGCISIPLGLSIFKAVVNSAKRSGKLKRSG
jgi:ABC-2 type transport system permease protein